jgi:hypothetical protein
MNWSCVQQDPGVWIFDVMLPPAGEEFKLLWMGDVHVDSPYCRRDLAEKDLGLARECEAPVLDIGDFFDVMQGKHDKRNFAAEMRREYVNGAPPYLTAVVDDAVEFMKPYGPLLTLRALGNHETSVEQHAGWSVTHSFCKDMAREHGAQYTGRGAYDGWVVIRCRKSKTSVCRVIVCRYFHGNGGAAPVTKGTIDTARKSDRLAGADLVISGHTHTEYKLPRMKEDLVYHAASGRYNKRVIKQVHVKLGGYKDETLAPFTSFSNERGKPSEALGSSWLRIRRGGPLGAEFMCEESIWA